MYSSVTMQRDRKGRNGILLDMERKLHANHAEQNFVCLEMTLFIIEGTFVGNCRVLVSDTQSHRN